MRSVGLLVALFTVSIVCGVGMAFAASGDLPDQDQSAESLSLSVPPNQSPGVELTERRTATSETFRLPDGALETRIHETPIHYQGADGQWKPIDEDLHTAEDAALSNGANAFDLDLPRRVGVGPVRLSTEGEWVSFELLGQATEPVEVEENVASYEAADGGVTFELASLANGVKEEIEIADASQASSYDFELRASAGLRPELTEAGAIEFRDGDGTPIVELPPPIMIDGAEERPAMSREVSYTLGPEEEEDTWRLTVEADRKWLEAGERTFPVRIDPSLHIPGASLDCGIQQHGYYGPQHPGFGGCDYYLKASHWAGQYGWYDIRERSLLRFNLAAIPAGSEVSSATLGLYSPWVAYNTTGVEARRVTRGWTAAANWGTYNGTNNWTNFGGDFSGEGAQILTDERGSQAGWWNFTNGLAPLVQSWVDNASNNNGLMIKLRDEPRECADGPQGMVDCVSREIWFSSSESTTESQRPYLDVTYYPLSVVEPPLRDALNRAEVPLSNGGKWSALSWAGGTHKTGQDTTGGWGPYDSYSTVNGAYWNSATFNDSGTGDAAAITMQTPPGAEGRYSSLWLNMPSPGSAKSGYQLSWTVVNPTTSTYAVRLSKWVSGTETAFQTLASASIATGSTLILSDNGGTVTAWKKLGGNPTSLISMSDSTYSTGYAGIEASGGTGRSLDFRAGSANPPPPNTTITTGPNGIAIPEAAFSFTSNEGVSSFECSLDGGAYGACTSPKAYPGLAEGSHVFRVRAKGPSGILDPTPAERSFQLIGVDKALVKTPLLDNLSRQEVPIATGKWSKASWANEIGGSWMGSYHGYGGNGALASAYWNSTTFSGTEGPIVVSATVGSGSVSSGERLALWLNAPSPGSARSGYEARFEGVNGSASNYKVELSRWVAGTRTVLGSTSGFSLPVGTKMVLVDKGESLALWTGTSSFTQTLAANDSAYSSGYAGLEVNGGAGTEYDFRAGNIDLQAPNTNITGSPTAKILVPDASFSFVATENGSSFECSIDGGAYGACASPKEFKGLAEGSHTFRVRAIDVVGNQDPSPAQRIFEVLDPPETSITSPQPSYTSGEEPPITFTADEGGSAFKCSLDGANPPTTPCTSPYSLPALGSGWHTFRVIATDSQGNTDPTPATWTFNQAPYPAAPSASKLTSPSEGYSSSSHYTLKAKWGNAPEGGGVTGVTFQAKFYTWKTFKTIPAKYLVDSNGDPVSWPLPVSKNPGETGPIFLDMKRYADEEVTPPWGVLPQYPEEELRFRAVFDGGTNAAGASEPVSVDFDRQRGGDASNATEAVGPASLDLLTGQFTISRTDVSLPVPGSEANLEFTRVYDSSASAEGENGKTHLLSYLWQPSVPVEQAAEGNGWTKVVVRHEDAILPYYEEGELVEEGIPAADWAEVLDNEGGGIAFDLVNGAYIAPDYAKEFALTKAGETFTLADANGTRTVFTKNQVGPVNEYLVNSVSWQATPKSARMVYQNTGNYHRLKMMIAPSALGITCDDSPGSADYALTEPGCRTLTFQYSDSPQHYTKDRLTSITYYNATGSNPQVVAEYKYNPKGRLIAEWDPRITPIQEEKYEYVPNEWEEDLTILAPPGEEAWAFDYYEDKSESRWEGELKSVSRASLVEETPIAQTTIAYGVPISGEDAPYDLSADTVAEWGQSDYPVNATAIFPPDEVPDDPPDDYSRAMIRYMDPDGNQVNTASVAPPGAEGDVITTSETDEHGNVVRELGAQNRLRALAAGASSVSRSHELETKRWFSADGTEMQEEFGPQHEVRLESGATVQARAHKIVVYDQGAPTPPAGTPWPHLPTWEITEALLPSLEAADQRVTQTKYDWSLRLPTETIVDPNGLNIRTRTVYDPATGLPIEQRMPGNPEGGDANTTKALYYTANSYPADKDCEKKPAWANLPCKNLPAAQPTPSSGNPQLPVTRFMAYSALDQPTEIQEKTAGILKRTTTNTYDSAGRLVKAMQTGEGTEFPATETSYSPTTGAPEAQRFVCEKECEGFDAQQASTTYDTLGRVKEYKDSDGNVSEVAYDLFGRPAIVFDGKGTQVMSYDEESGALTQVSDSAAGTFTASYDADGRIVEAGLPNGLVAKITLDEAGSAVHLDYEKATYCSSDCTWLEFDREESILGQVLHQTSTLSHQEYSYDKAGRLTRTKDWDAPMGGSCTTREYKFEGNSGKNSNRTKMMTRAPGMGGICSEAGGATQSYEYDTADRLIGEGIAYDALGRITSLAGKYAGGGTLSTSYYTNNLVKTQSQDGTTNTYELDATLRQRKRIRVGGSEAGTEIYHYAGGSDSPAWIDRGTSWTRNIAGIGGLGAIENSATEKVILQLPNLHGDVVGTASLDPSATEPLSTFEFDEFGNPKQGSPPKFGWLGRKRRRTELPSGVIQMGVRSYVPALGRFLTPDPIPGGSANAYDYAYQDPVNTFDLTGEKCVGPQAWIKRCKAKKTIAWMKRSNKNRAIILRFKTKRAAEYFAYSLSRNYIKEMQQKVGKWKREELANLYRQARESRIRASLLPVEPFSCTDLSIGVGLAGMVLSKTPWGVALVISGAGLGPDIAEKAGVC